jgi:hypothetical protein
MCSEPFGSVHPCLLFEFQRPQSRAHWGAVWVSLRCRGGRNVDGLGPSLFDGAAALGLTLLVPVAGTVKGVESIFVFRFDDRAPGGFAAPRMSVSYAVPRDPSTRPIAIS